MIQQIWEYLASLYQDIPVTVYEGMLSILCLGFVVIIVFCGLKRGWRKIAGLLLVEYLFLLFCSTIVFRATSEVQKYDWEPFWSYQAIEEGRLELLPENIMNVVVFVPVGILLGCAFCSMRWWKALLIGCGISVSIEALQYFFHRGFAETDDVMHNTLGGMIGYILVKGSWFMVHGLTKK